jgi:hypothetical protein
MVCHCTVRKAAVNPEFCASCQKIPICQITNADYTQVSQFLGIYGPALNAALILLLKIPRNMKENMTARLGILLLALALPAAGDVPAQPVYTSGFSVALRIGGELSEALPAKFGEQLDAHPIALQPQDAPLVTPVDTKEDDKTVKQVCMSAGFIDLINHICHAKAIDHVQPGYFDQYVKNLCHDGVVQPPNIVDPRFWTDDVINDQLSYFNQMIGWLEAINMSHQYLGYYAKYSSKMISAGGKITPINTFLSDTEWEAALRAGAVNALNCALATEGPRALFDAINSMPKRPDWASYIVPPTIDLKKLNKQLQQYETDFFHGQLK